MITPSFHLYVPSSHNIHTYIYIYKYHFRAEQRVSSNLHGRAVPYMTLYKPLQAVLAASSRFANVSDKEITELNISAVPKSMQYTTKYGVRIFKGETASLNLLVYFETVQKATVSTAGAEIVTGELHCNS